MNVYYESRWDLSESFLVSENKNNYYAPHFHRNIELHYIRSGCVLACVDGETGKFEKDDIIFIPGYRTHSFSTPVSSDVIVIIIPQELTGDFEELFKREILEIRLKDKIFNKLILAQLETMLKNRAVCSRIINKGYVNIIIGMLIKHYPLMPVKARGGAYFITEMLRYIDSHLTENLSLNILAKHFGYSRCYISKLFHEYVGENLNEYVNEVRIRHAATLLTRGKIQKVSELGESSGFNSPATFYRSFKKVYGVSPKEYVTNIASDNMRHEHYDYEAGFTD